VLCGAATAAGLIIDIAMVRRNRGRWILAVIDDRAAAPPLTRRAPSVPFGRRGDSTRTTEGGRVFV